jgi:large subunit ribosomal protein L21
MFAVIQTGGKQYKVEVGQKLAVEKLETPAGGEIVFDKVLLKGEGEQVTIGRPFIAGAAVHGKLVKQGRAKKVIVFRYHSKTRYKKKKGHRQPFTEIEITSIN